MVAADKFEVVVDARCGANSSATGTKEHYTVPNGYFVNASTNSPDNPYGWSYVQTSYFGRKPHINVHFGDPISANDGRPPLYRTVCVSAYVEGDRGPGAGGGSVHYTLTGYGIKA